MIRLKVFISSVQKELEEERQAVGRMLATDPFLAASVVPRLFDKYPAPLRPNKQAYLDLLRTCHVYLLIIGRDYGAVQEDGRSATHQEYLLARELALPTLVCVKGDGGFEREPREGEFLQRARDDGHTYSRFATIPELLEAARERLVEYLRTHFETEPTPRQTSLAQATQRAAAPFERQSIATVAWEALDQNLARELAAAAEAKPAEKLDPPQIVEALYSRGYLTLDQPTAKFHPTAAAVLLLGQSPARTFPQARLQLDAYTGKVPDAAPLDSVHVDAPLPQAIEQSVAFVRRNTSSPLKIAGLHRRRAEPLPPEVLREAIVNAVAHRDYELTGARVTVEVFADRVVVRSPGLPAGGQSLERIQQGEAPSRSRNPLIVQGLTWLELMDDRGTGIRRMRELMQQRGLAAPSFVLRDDELVLTMMLAVEVAESAVGGSTPPTVASKPPIPIGLTEDQAAIMEGVSRQGFVTTGWCVKNRGLPRVTAWRLLQELVQKGVLVEEGVGRGVKYRQAGAAETEHVSGLKD